MTKDEFEGRVLSILNNDNKMDCTIDASSEIYELAIEYFRTIHSRALACHCECLGMNAENSFAVCANAIPPYNVEHYNEVMQRWGLINEKGEPLI